MDADVAPWLSAQVQDHSDTVALVCDQGSVSFAALHCAADRIARVLAGALRAGDRIALLMRSSLRFVEIVHAVPQAGLTLVPLNERLLPHELALQLENAAPAWLLYDETHAETARRLAAGGGFRAVDAFAELDGMPARGSPRESLRLSDLHSIIYTSGTTGAPKGVMLTNGNHLANAKASLARLGCTSGDRWLAALPLYHVGGLSILLRAAICGMSVVLQRRFDPSEAYRAISEHGVTVASLVPTALARLLDAARGGEFPASFRCALIGGGPLPGVLRERAARAGVPLSCTYGLTEAASQVATTEAGEQAGCSGSSGRPLDGTEVRIDNCDASGFGEILVRGPQVTPGYFRNPEATSRALRDGWLHTGDVGRLDAHGRLWVAARRSDLIVTGGENVSPDEVEAELASHPSVREAAVFGEDDPIWGQRVAAAVILAPDAALDAEALQAWCRQRLAGYKVPRRFRAVDELPRTSSGKVQRHRLAGGS